MIMQKDAKMLKSDIIWLIQQKKGIHSDIEIIFQFCSIHSTNQAPIPDKYQFNFFLIICPSLVIKLQLIRSLGKRVIIEGYPKLPDCNSDDWFKEEEIRRLNKIRAEECGIQCFKQPLGLPSLEIDKILNSV